MEIPFHLITCVLEVALSSQQSYMPSADLVIITQVLSVHSASCVMRHVSCVRRHVSGVMCQVSGVVCHVSCVICHVS